MSARTLVVAGLVWLGAAQVLAQSSIPAGFHGDWVPATGGCDAQVRLRVAEGTLTLVNAQDSQSWGNVAVPATYWGPDYTGISVVALPDFDASQPFTVYFNADEKKGVTKVNIYNEMGGRLSPQLAAIQAAAKKLAARFPLNDVPLKNCAEGRSGQ